ncbi:MAG: ATP-binding protein [Duncaniella sp.]|nr:ATP-binding protein [Duncaniella sp.]
MLKKFKVKGFTSFENELVFDLSSPNAYAFLPECVRDVVVRAAVIHGKNGVGKSNLGLAIFDIFEHLTDFKIEESLYRTYINANLPDNEAMAEFEYTFGFEGQNVVYSYGKTSLHNIAYERLMIDGNEIIHSDRRVDTSFSCTLPGTESLRTTLSDSSISVLKYIKANTERDSSPENKAFDALFDFVSRMLYFRCLNFNTYIAEPPKNNNFLTDIIEAGKVKEFETFLHECGIECNLDVEGDGKLRTIVNVYGSKTYPLSEVWSTGTQSLSLFFCWTMRMQMGKVSFLFIDEFDAFYHYSLSRTVIRYLRGITPIQFAVTTHNPATITTSLLRPDCYFIMDKSGLLPLSARTNRELREAHNLEKMYKADAFANLSGN